MKIERVDLRTVGMPLVTPFQTSFGTQKDRLALLVTVYSDGLQGWGECTAGEDPFYSSETTKTAWYVLEEYLIPALFNGRISAEPENFYRESGFVRGHSMARAALEAALWDLKARRENIPLHRLFGGAKDKLPTGISIGIQPSVEELLEQIEKNKGHGYKRIKIKIKPGWDVDVVEAIRVKYPDLPLMVDANCAYSLEQADYLAQLDEFNLMMIEQPFANDDFLDHAELQRRLRTPICLDESIKGVSALRTAVSLKACRVLNIKQGRVGGPSQAIECNNISRDAGIPAWAGGMLETGIGRALNIHLATLDNFVLPGDISASSRYWEEDIIDPPVELNPDGSITVPKGPGIGYLPRVNRIEAVTQKLQTLPG